jgi:hypothetical protein
MFVLKSFLRGALAWLLPAVVAGALLGVRVAGLWPDAESVWAQVPRRYWEDMHLAIAYFLYGEFPVETNWVLKERTPTGLRFVEQYPHLTRAVAEAEVQPWQFWRKVPANRFRRQTIAEVSPRFDDSGRPLLLGLAFRLRGGVMPFLIFWLAVLVALPVLAWIAWEFVAADRTAAGAFFLLGAGLSQFVADNLGLAYSTSGFYVIAILSLTALAAYATRRDRPSTAALGLRVLAVGLAFGVCVMCRGGCLLLLPAFLLALLVAAWRRGPFVIAGSVLLFLAPYACFRAATTRLVSRTLAAHHSSDIPQQHAFWFGIWSGLGDFDRSRGHVWSDLATWDAVIKAGGTPVQSWRYDPGNEVVLRRLVLTDIREDPAWFAAILARRVWSTIVQPKLWPWGPWGGRSIAPAAHPNEGVIDGYYALTSTAEWFGVGRRSFELPMPLLIAPTLAVIVWALRERRREDLLLLGIVWLAVLPLPVLVTTASALEPQAAVLPYLLGGALFVERVLARRAPALARVRPREVLPGEAPSLLAAATRTEDR